MQTAINNEIAYAADGDIIKIPAGTCTWTGTSVSGKFTKSVTIQGAGAISATTGGASITGSDLTSIINHTPGNSPAMSIGTVSGKSLRITGIAFLEDSGTTNPRFGGTLSIGGNSSTIRIDHCHLTLVISGSKGLQFNDNITGVVDHVYSNTGFDITFVFENGGHWKGGDVGAGDPGGYGNSSWADADNFGTSQFIFIEDSRVEAGNTGYWNDCARGGRYVIRHSTLIGTNTVEHGTHNEYRGCRASEYYLNDGTGSPAGTYPMAGGMFGTISGTHLVWGNNAFGWENVYHTDYYRINGTTYGASPVPPNGFGMCGAVTNGPSVWDQNSGSNMNACLDLPSRGQGDLLTPLVTSFADILNSTTGTRTWPHQARVPIYMWNNTLANNGGRGMFANAVPVLSDNQDYFQQFGTFAEPGSFNGTAGVGTGTINPNLAGAYPGAPACSSALGYPGPGYWNSSTNHLWVCTAANTWTDYYTPYTYPHPLTQSSSSATTVAPPTGLSATVQ